MRVFKTSYLDKTGQSHEVKNYYVELCDRVGKPDDSHLFLL
jgi:hypothetical protein